MSVEINIPFPGLYESYLSGEIDHNEEREIESLAELESENWPAPLQLPESDIGELWFDAMNYTIAHEAMAHAYFEAFDTWAGEALGETRNSVDSCGMKWSLMTSPREYNFETDRLFATVSMAFIKRLWEMSRDDSHDTLKRAIYERFTSCSGFISHYPNSLDAWGPIESWDYNQLGTLLIACLELSGADYESLMFDALESDSACNAIDSAMDWQRLESDMTEKRAEYLESWAQENPIDCAAWLAANEESAAPMLHHTQLPEDMPQGDACGSFYRCKKTSDLFGQGVA